MSTKGIESIAIILTPNLSSPTKPKPGTPPGTPTQPAGRTCTSGCAWQWVASWDSGWYSMNSWSLPTQHFQSNPEGKRSLNTDCVQPADEGSLVTVPKDSESIWENYGGGQLEAGGKDVCCLLYFANTDCRKDEGGWHDQCPPAVPPVEGQTEKTLFAVKAFQVHGCTGLWEPDAVGA